MVHAPAVLAQTALVEKISEQLHGLLGLEVLSLPIW
jgi:hypothetical protein